MSTNAALPKKLTGTFITPPASLSHYTTLRGMMGIINTATIWASNVSFLNDSRELSYGLEATERAIKRFTSKGTYRNWSRILQAVMEKLRAGEIPNTYAACFCQSSDLLSQWRGYGGVEQGIAVVFDRRELVSNLKTSKASLFPIVYGKLKAAGQITRELSEQLDDLDQDMEFESFTETERESKARSIICRLLPQFKHLGFSDEREWRFVVQQEKIRSTVNFRANANVMIPYLKLSLGPKKQLPIKYIRIGPGRDQELTKKSLQLYLSKVSTREIEVHLSKVPYRM